MKMTIDEGVAAACGRNFCDALKIANHLANDGDSKGADEILRAIACSVVSFARVRGCDFP